MIWFLRFHLPRPDHNQLVKFIPAEMLYIQGYCCFAWTITKFHSDAVDGHVTLASFIKKKGIRRVMVLRAVG